MLAEHDGEGGSRSESKSKAADGDVGAPNAAAHGIGKVAGPYGDAAGRYVKNQIVEYYSETHKEWLPAQVTAIDAEGRIQVHCKPNAWLSLSQQAHKVRPKQGESKSDNKENEVKAAAAPANKPPAMPGHVPRSGQAGDGAANAAPKGPRSASYHTPRHVQMYNANTPPPGAYGFAGARGATPPRAASPSPFSHRNSPRLAYGRPNPNSAFSPRVVGTPRSRGYMKEVDRNSEAPSQLGAPFPHMAGAASPRSNRPPFASNSPRFAPPSQGGYGGNNHYY